MQLYRQFSVLTYTLADSDSNNENLDMSMVLQWLYTWEIIPLNNPHFSSGKHKIEINIYKNDTKGF